MSAMTARPIAIPSRDMQRPADPAASMRPNTLAVSYRPGLDAEESLRLDIADLTARLTALGEKNLPSPPISPSPLARSLAYNQGGFSPPGTFAIGSPMDRAPMLSLDQLARSPPVNSAAFRVGSPPRAQPRDRQMAFSVMNDNGFDLGTPPGVLPEPLFSLPNARPRRKDRSPSMAPSNDGLATSPGPRAVRGFAISRSPPPPPPLPVAEAAPTGLPARAVVLSPTLSKMPALDSIAEQGGPTSASHEVKESQFDDPSDVNEDEWLCYACGHAHDVDDEAAVTIQPCGTTACAPSLRTRLHNGGIAKCPRCSGSAAHLDFLVCTPRSRVDTVATPRFPPVHLYPTRFTQEGRPREPPLPALAVSSTRSTPSPPARLKPLTATSAHGRTRSSTSKRTDAQSTSNGRPPAITIAHVSDFAASASASSEALLTSDDDDGDTSEDSDANDDRRQGPRKESLQPTDGLQLLMGQTTSGRGADVLIEKRSATPQRGGPWDLGARWTGTTTSLALAPPGAASPRRKGSSSPAAAMLSRKRAGSPTPSSRSDSPAPVEQRPPDLILQRLLLRLELVPEVAILTTLVAFGAHRLRTMHFADDSPAALAGLPHIPLSALIALLVLLPLTTLLRRWPRRYLLYPFTDERGYRDAQQADDGLACGIGVPILLSSATLWDCLHAARPEDIGLEGVRSLTEVWRWNRFPLPPNFRSSPQDVYTAVLRARTSLFLLSIANAYVLLFNLLLARTIFKIAWLPENNTKRFFGAAALSTFVSAALWLGFTGWAVLHGPSHYLHPLELAFSTFLYQMSMYSISRLVRRGFTLGELSIASAAGIALALEYWRITYAKWFAATSPSVPALFRAPTPLIPFQHVLVPGVFLCGFILSPLLVLSRHIASKPIRRLRWPSHKERNRRLLAAGVFVGLLAIIALLLSPWAGWALGGTTYSAWTWAFRFGFFGGDGVDGMAFGELRGWPRWRRIAIGAYWLGVAIVAVGGWQTRLVRVRRIRMSKEQVSISGATSDSVEGVREDKRRHVSLDLRRKFFHALAVLMFIPGIAFDPAFTSLSFSVAFAIFTFAEYARYFALFPIGAPIHVFFHEFTDAKDAGPVILSHFYLLTGCAGGLWLEGKGIKRFSGVLALGLGDALASIIGRRVGGPRWRTTTPKTVVGTTAFVLSIMLAALALRWAGWVEPFSWWRYFGATCVAAAIEAVSMQNDNLIVPLVLWSALSLGNV